MVDKEIPYHTLSKYSETKNLRQNDQSLVSTLDKKNPSTFNCHQFISILSDEFLLKVSSRKRFNFTTASTLTKYFAYGCSFSNIIT